MWRKEDESEAKKIGENIGVGREGREWGREGRTTIMVREKKDKEKGR